MAAFPSHEPADRLCQCLSTVGTHFFYSSKGAGNYFPFKPLLAEWTLEDRSRPAAGGGFLGRKMK